MSMSFRNVAPLIVGLLILSGCVNQRKATESNAFVFKNVDSLRAFINRHIDSTFYISKKSDVGLSIYPVATFSYTYEEEKKFKAFLKLRHLCDYPYLLFW